MFNFFKKKGGKAEAAAGTADTPRKLSNDDSTKPLSVDTRAPRNDNDVTNENFNTIRKDVVNLLIPETDYNNQKTGVGAILQIMAGKRRRGKRKPTRADSYRVSPPKETQIALQRSNSELAKKDCDVAPTPAKNNLDAAHADANPADFVKALVLQKYANKTPVDNKHHVSLVYVSDEPNLDEKRHAEALLREIARSIDCTVDKLNEDKEKGQMGTTDSKIDKGRGKSEPVYETIDDRSGASSIDSYKNDLKGELEKLLNVETKEVKDSNEQDTDGDSPGAIKKSNLKPPKSDTEACSDDDRSDCGKKRVTFRKHIVFDDGEQQTDEEVGSSFESISSEEEEEEYLEEITENELHTAFDGDNKTVINVSKENKEPITIKIEPPDDGLKRMSSDNSDSGFIEIGDKNGSGDDLTSDVKSLPLEVEASESEVSESETEEEIIEEIEEVSIAKVVEPSDPKHDDNTKTLVTQEDKFQSQVAALTELADSRFGEAERARELISAYRKEIEAKDHEIEELKKDLAAAYKESELVRQKSHSLEEELAAARSCSADLADQLQRRNDESLRQLRTELETALTQRAELESRVLALERDRDRLEQEQVLQQEKAQEALIAAEANTAKWRSAHEAARSQAAARAERMLADCEWKMRELEKKAREAEKQKKELIETVEELKKAPKPNLSHVAELQQLRGLATEQQRSVQSLTLQLQQVETREEALKLEVHRLKELLDRETKSGKEKEERHLQTIKRLEQQHAKTVETIKAEQTAVAASTRAALERAHAEKTRAALAQLRSESEQEARNADRKLREVTTRFENLKEVLASKETQFESAIAEAHSKADWDILQLRHLLDKADINYANKMESLNETFEKEKESIIDEWTKKFKAVEQQAATAADEARRLLETTRSKLIADRVEQISKLKDNHRQEMDEQWEQFMTDKESCLSRMKMECRQEGEEERVKREKDLLEEIAELKSQIQSKTCDFNNLSIKAAACGRELAVTEQELREALVREKDLREKRSDDATKIKQVEKASREQIEHLTRKCACLRKLFDDMRGRLTARERAAEQEARAREKELHHLRGEVARLTKILVEQSSPKLGARTRADGCETAQQNDEISKSAPLACDAQTNPPRRKGGTLRTPEPIRRPTCPLPDLTSLAPRLSANVAQNGRRRAKSVDLPAVQVPIRIKQLEGKNRE